MSGCLSSTRLKRRLMPSEIADEPECLRLSVWFAFGRFAVRERS